MRQLRWLARSPAVRRKVGGESRATRALISPDALARRSLQAATRRRARSRRSADYRDRPPAGPVTESDTAAGRRPSRARKSSDFSDGPPAPRLLPFGTAALEKSLVAGPGVSWRELPLGPAVLSPRRHRLAATPLRLRPRTLAGDQRSSPSRTSGDRVGAFGQGGA
jgi:hypothetical protein